MKRIIVLVLTMSFLVSMVGGCSNESESLRLGTMPTYSAAIYAVGIEKGFFDDANVRVELTVFRSARDRDGGATAGELDGFMTDIMGAVNLNANGFPFIMTSKEYEDFGVMAGSDVNIESIVLAKTGISENTVIEYIVDTYIGKDVEKVNLLSLPDRMGALLGGELDYGVFPEPFMGIVKGNGGQVVFNTAAKDFHPVVLVFNEDYIKNHSETVVSFYEAYVKTVEYMQTTDYDEYKDVLVTYGLATEETVDLYRLPVEAYGLNKVDENAYNDIVAWMISKGLLDIDIAFEDVHTIQFVE